MTVVREKPSHHWRDIVLHGSTLAIHNLDKMRAAMLPREYAVSVS